MHPTEVRLLALVALIERAEMHGEALHVSKVDVALGHDSSFLCIALFYRRLHGQLSDLSLLAQVFFNELA